MSKNNVVKQNTVAINSFLDNAGTTVQPFLFEMLAIFTKTDPGYTEEYRQNCVMHFELLNYLVDEIKQV